jgi:ribonuclease BN (tRNA processing enzyme)
MTAKEAGRLADAAKVKKLVLTHLNPFNNLTLLKREAKLHLKVRLKPQKC